MNVQSNWWEHFFEGAPVDLWLQAVSPEHTAREADALVRALDLPAGAELLDVPCGNGRLSCALAERGYRLTGVDWSHEFLAHARSSGAGRDVTWERRDMRDLPWPARFDGAFCFGNSFGYLDDEGNEAFLRAVAAALKPGARFVLETPMVLENMLGWLQERPWWQVGDHAPARREPVRSGPRAPRHRVHTHLERPGGHALWLSSRVHLPSAG